MRRIIHTTLAVFAVAVSATACSDATTAASPATPAPTGPAISFPADDLDWRELPDTGGVRYANVRGDLAGSGPYEAFVEFPAGKDNPPHTHTSDLPTVVLSGTFYAVFDGKRVEYPAGSFYTLTADVPHLSGCAPGPTCQLFQYQSDHFDLIPTTD
ncbi:cupin domain-containing protein [Nocardia sp. NPDC058176]|uniref:cupin domain-containing protein n=1 Tax=Nocardia sp. NPDC058176 TaxID=3346368 RepID=UPI0036DEEC1F